MSDIENHVVSLETAKRMKELGWRQDAFYVWCCSNGTISDGFKKTAVKPFLVPDNTASIYRECDPIAAPILSEILDALPTYYPKDDTYFLVLSKNSGWTVEYACKGGDSLVYCEHESSVEVAALLWIKLVEEGVISSNEKE